MVTKSFFSKGIELTGFYIGPKLTIPFLGIKCHIPSAKRGEFVGRKVFDLLFNRFHFVHISPTLGHQPVAFEDGHLFITSGDLFPEIA